MKVIAILLSTILFSCTNRIEKKTKIQAFCIITKGETIQLDKDNFMDLEKMHSVITRINNQIFETKLIKGKLKSYQIKLDSKYLNYVLKGFEENSAKNLDEQIVAKINSPAFCDLVSGYFLNDSEKSNFCLLTSKNLKRLLQMYDNRNKILVRDKDKKTMLESVYFKINSLRWDYYMSNKYHYKDIRIYNKMNFEN